MPKMCVDTHFAGRLACMPIDFRSAVVLWATGAARILIYIYVLVLSSEEAVRLAPNGLH